MTDHIAYVVPADNRREVPCLQCNATSKSVEAHFKHYYTCDGGKRAANRKGKVVKAS